MIDVAHHKCIVNSNYNIEHALFDTHNQHDVKQNKHKWSTLTNIC